LSQIAAARRATRVVMVGPVGIGGDRPVSVQSMTKAPAEDAGATLAQLEELAAAGCEVCRLAVPDTGALGAFARVAARSPLPLVADIHFDYRLALGAIEAGAAKLRINPGNLGGEAPLKEVARRASGAGVPIRVGVNLGSLEAGLARSRGHTARAMAESALEYVRQLEDLGVPGIVVSAKAPDVGRTVEAYRLISGETDWPLHVGVTEAGRGVAGAVKSALGIGLLLAEGIGDTIRVSLTGDPVDEVRAGYAILRSLGLRERGVEIISCPTCGRCRLDVPSVAAQVERRLAGDAEPIVVAVMGCAVNGPGEARRADVGLAGAADGKAVLFAEGRVVRSVEASEAVEQLLGEIARRQGRSGASQGRE
jgi:(E)-4-hydroxy-3-methylbut-2-enyl-diphosphate synthase